MKTLSKSLFAAAFLCAGAIGVACSDSDDGPVSTPDAGAVDAGKADTAAVLDAGTDAAPLFDEKDFPPTNGSALVTWLGKGFYKTGGWKCEPAARTGNPPSIHGKQRVCSNALVSAHGAGEYPVGSASVKELYDAAGTTLVGHAVTAHPKAGGAAAWFFFQITDKSVYAEGFGDNASVKAKCSDCHGGAGSGYPGHDFVFGQVK